MDQLFSLLLMLLMQFLGGAAATPPPQEPAPTTAEIAKVISVTDGDTIVVDIDGERETVRYIGIDTPELYRDGEPACYSQQATQKNRDLVAGKIVRLESDAENRDRFNRLLRYVFVDEELVNARLLQEGYATTLTIKPNTSYAASFAELEDTARATPVGLWASCGAVPNLEQTIQMQDNESVTIDVTQMTSGQQKLLSFLGIDAATFTVTQQMISCANSAVGIERMIDIVSGQMPTLREGVALVGCYTSS